MAVTFVGSSAQTSQGDGGDRDTITVNFPNHLEGDLLVAWIQTSEDGESGSERIDPEAGFTEIVDVNVSAPSGVGLYVAWHIATSDDEILSRNFNAGSDTGFVATGMVFRGVDQTTPIDVQATGSTQGNATSNTTPSVTTTVPNVFVNRIIAIDDNLAVGTTPSPSGYALRKTIQASAPGNGVTGLWYDMVEPSAGATGTEVISWTDSDENRSFVFGLRPDKEKEEFTVDAILKKVQSKTFTIDARVGVFIKGFTVDAIAQKTQTKTFTIDAIAKKTQTKTFTVDAKLAFIENFNVDSCLRASGDDGNCAVTDVQSGTVSFTGTTTDVTLPKAVVLANSFLTFQYNVDNNAVAQVLVRGQLTSTTNIHFERTTGGATVDLSWYVIESPFISAQRGSFVFSTTTENQTITSVDTTKSFSLASWEVAGSSWGDGDTIRHRLTSATNLEFLIDVLPGGFEPTVDWEVVEYTGAIVQRGIVTMAMEETVKNIAITLVDQTRTMVHLSNTINGAQAIPPDEQGLTGELTSSTNLRIQRNPDSDERAMQIAWEVTEFPAGVQVQSGSESFGTTQTVANVTISPVGLARTAVLISHDMKGGRTNDATDDNPHTVWYKAELTTTTNLQLTRASSDSSTGDVVWYVIEFSPKQQECFDVDAKLIRARTFTVDAILEVEPEEKEFTVDAIVVDRFTETFLVDSFVEKEQTKDFDVDAIVVNRFDADFTVDGFVQKQDNDETFLIDALVQKKDNDETFDVDAFIQKTQTETFSVDTFSQKEKTKTFTVDALTQRQNIDKDFTVNTLIQRKDNDEEFDADSFVQKTKTETFDVDGLIQALNQEETFTIDAFVQDTQTKDFTVDALLQATQTETFDIDALIQVLNQEETFTVDAILRATFDKDFTVDAFIRALNQEKIFTVDTLIEAENEKMFLVDGLAQATQTETFDVDSIVVNRFDEDFTIDAKVIVRRTKTFTIDGLTQRQNINKTFLVDAFIQKTKTETFLVDAFVQATQTKDFLIDGCIRGTIDKDFTVDSFIQRLNIDETFTIDSFIQRQNINKDFLIDGCVRGTINKDFTVDALPLATIDEDFTIDSFVQKLDNDKTFLVDSRITLRPEKSFEVDGLTQGANTKTFEVDALLEGENTAMFLIDSILQATFNEDFVIDGLTKATQTETFLVDARIAQKNTEVFDIDVFIQDTFDKTFNVDALIKDTATEDFTVDSILLAIQTETFLIDARIEQINVETFAVDSLLSKKQTTTFEIDAQITQVQTKDFTVDSKLAERKLFKIDAQIVRVERFDVDSILKAIFTEDLTVDSILKQGNQEFFLVDGLLVTVNQETFSVDAVLAETKTKTFEVDSLIQKQDNDKTFIIDGLLPVTNVEEFEVDTRVLATFDEEFDIDSFVLKTQDEVFDIDAQIELEKTKTFIVDSLTLGTQTESFSVDTFSQELKNTKDFTVDARLRVTKTKAFTIEAIVRNTFIKDFTVDSQLFAVLTFNKDFEIDGITKALNTEKDFTIDGIPVIGTSRIWCIDALLQATQTFNFTIDAKVVNVNTEDFTVDAQLIATAVNTKDFTVNALLKAFGDNGNCPVLATELIWSDFSTFDITRLGGTGNNTRSGIKVIAGAGAIGKVVGDITWHLARNGSGTTGTVKATIRNKSDNIVSQSAPVDILTLTLGFTPDILNFPLDKVRIIEEGDRLLLEFENCVGCASGTPNVFHHGEVLTSPPGGFVTTSFEPSTGKYTDITSGFAYGGVASGFPTSAVQAKQHSCAEVDAQLAILDKTESFTVEGSITGAKEIEFTVDARVTGGITKTFTVDAQIFLPTLANFTVDGFLEQPVSLLNFTVDAELEEIFTQVFTVDSILIGAGQKVFTIDGLTLGTQTKDFIIDADIRNVKTTTFDVDVVLKATFNEDFSVDTILRGEIEKEFTIDAKVVRLDLFTVDALIKSLGDVRCSSDTIIFDDDFTTDDGWSVIGTQILIDVADSNLLRINCMESVFIIGIQQAVKTLPIPVNNNDTQIADIIFEFDHFHFKPCGLNFTMPVPFAHRADWALTETDLHSQQNPAQGMLSYEFVPVPPASNQDPQGIRAVYADGVTEVFTSLISLVDNTQYYPRVTKQLNGILKLEIFLDSGRTTHASGSPVQADASSVSNKQLNFIQVANALGGGPARELKANIDNVIVSQSLCPQVTVDAIIGLPKKSFLVDAILSTQGKFTVDAFLIIINSETFEIDASVKALDTEKEFTVDAEITRGKIFLVNSIIKLIADKVFTIDSRLSEIEEFNVDSKLVDRFEEDFAVDGSTLGTVEKDFTIDGILIVFPSGLILIDAIIQAQNNDKTFTIDSVIKALETEKDFTVDSQLVQDEIPKQFTIDGRIAIIQTTTFDIDGVIFLSGENGICNFFPETNLAVDTGFEQFIGPVQPVHEIGVEILIGQEVVLSNQQVRSVTFLLRSSNFPNEIVTPSSTLNAEIWSDVVIGNLGGETTEATSENVINSFSLPPGDWTKVKFTFDINTTPFLTGDFVVGFKHLSDVNDPKGVGTARPVISNSNVISGSAVLRHGANSTLGNEDEWIFLTEDQKDMIIQLEVLNGDDIILGEGNQCPLVDAVLVNTPNKFLVDAKLTTRFESEFSIDTVLFPLPKPFLIDAVLVGTQLPFIIDSIIVPEPKIFTVDALILVVPGKLYNIDAVIFGKDTNENFLVDSFVKVLSKNSPKFNLNAFLFVRRTKDFTVDGSTKFFNQVSPFTIDALVIFFPSQLPTIDGMVKELGTQKPLFVDGFVQMLNFNFTRSIDALIVQENIGKTFLVEGFIAQRAEKEFTIDAKLGIPQDPFLFTVDAMLLLENHRWQIDSLLQKSINKLFLIEALVVGKQQKPFLVSGLTKGFSIDENFTVDALVQKLGTDGTCPAGGETVSTVLDNIDLFDTQVNTTSTNFKIGQRWTPTVGEVALLGNGITKITLWHGHTGGNGSFDTFVWSNATVGTSSETVVRDAGTFFFFGSSSTISKRTRTLFDATGTNPQIWLPTAGVEYVLGIVENFPGTAQTRKTSTDTNNGVFTTRSSGGNWADTVGQDWTLQLTIEQSDLGQGSQNFCIGVDGRLQEIPLANFTVDAVIKGIGLTFDFTVDTSLVRVQGFSINGVIQALGDGSVFTGNNGNTNANNTTNPNVSQTTDDNTLTLPLGTLVGQRLRLPTAPIRVTDYTFVIHRAGTAGTPTGTLTGKIYKNSIAGNTIVVGDLRATSDNVVNLASITTNTNGQNVTFTFTDPPEITGDDNVFIGFDIAGSNEEMFLHTESTGTVIDGGDSNIEVSGVWGVDSGLDAVLTLNIDLIQRQRASALIKSFVGRFSPQHEVNALVKSIGGESGSFIPAEFTVGANIRFKQEAPPTFVDAILIGSQDFSVSAFVGDTLFVGLEVESVIVENNSNEGVESVIVENNSDSGVESVIGQDT